MQIHNRQYNSVSVNILAESWLYTAKPYFAAREKETRKERYQIAYCALANAFINFNPAIIQQHLAPDTIAGIRRLDAEEPQITRKDDRLICLFQYALYREAAMDFVTRFIEMLRPEEAGHYKFLRETTVDVSWKTAIQDALLQRAQETQAGRRQLDKSLCTWHKEIARRGRNAPELHARLVDLASQAAIDMALTAFPKGHIKQYTSCYIHLAQKARPAALKNAWEQYMQTVPWSQADPEIVALYHRRLGNAIYRDTLPYIRPNELGLFVSQYKNSILSTRGGAQALAAAQQNYEHNELADAHAELHEAIQRVRQVQKTLSAFAKHPRDSLDYRALRRSRRP